MSKIDLHIHSTASDGRLSPTEIVRQAVEKGLTVIAIADHDSVDGITPSLMAAEAFPSLKVIPCVEISTDVPNGEVHVLGYFIDYTNHEFQATLERLRHSRLQRSQGMIAKLNNLGIHKNQKSFHCILLALVYHRQFRKRVHFRYHYNQMQ